MIAVLVLLFQLGGMPSCLPPCYGVVITTNPAQYECECPPEPQIVYDDPIKLDNPWTLEIDPDGTAAEIEWEVKQLGDWLCVRQPKREEEK